MTKVQKQVSLSAALVLLLMVIDQWIKIYVKTHFYLGEDVQVTNWFHLIFVENNGMAFGWEFFGKLFLTSFRILAMFFIGWYIWKRINRGIGYGYLFVLCLVLAGAAGNIIDCVFYGEVFSASGYNPYLNDSLAHFVPFGEGYGSILQGRVVDMFQFPLFEFDWPSWLPFIGGRHFLFFSPIFNFADACISCGVVSLLLFFRDEISSDDLLTFGSKPEDEEKSTKE